MAAIAISVWNSSGQVDFFFPLKQAEITVYSPFQPEQNSSLFPFYNDGTNSTLFSWQKKVSFYFGFGEFLALL